MGQQAPPQQLAQQQLAQHVQQMDHGGHANALQPPAQHMMQGMMGPAAAQHLEQQSSASGAVPMSSANQIAPSMSVDIDMDNVESSADSVVPSIALQVSLYSLELCLQSNTVFLLPHPRDQGAQLIVLVCDSQADEPAFTRNKIRAFLHSHTCYELIPESGKVVILDVGLPIRQAFHALHEQVPNFS